MFSNGHVTTHPATGPAWMLKLAGDVQDNSIIIVNAFGQTVELRTTPTAGSLDLNALQPGSYFATAMISGERKVSRFVVER